MKRRGDKDNIPAVEKLYKKNQQDYSASGGFGAKDDVYEERRNRATTSYQQRQHRAFNAVPKPDDCTECGDFLGESELWDRYNFAVCSVCNDKEGRHKLITRTEAKDRFLLKDCDFDLRKPPLRFISKKNPHNPRYGDMKLYLLPQLEARAIEVHGSLESIEELKELKTSRRDAMNEKRFERKIKAMRTEMKSACAPKALPKVTHTHVYGPEEFDAESDQYKKNCTECDHVTYYDKM
uniref:XPA_C domain-containing protein n=1 Tax=Panagrellus redivivus TaxID=6233 RepID=A0A7E4ZT55_PANRE